MEVRYHPSASRDLSEAIRYFEENTISAGDRFKARLVEAVEILVKHPHFGHPVGPDGFRQIALKGFPWDLVYFPNEVSGVLWITVVRHQARHPSYGMKRRLPDF